MLYRVILLIALVLSGCTADANRGTVSGTVTLDGQPLKTGTIRFEPADGQTATADAPIADGSFTATIPLGEKRVSISAPKVIGKKRVYETPDSPTVEIVEELLPEKYNIRTTLTLTVAPGNQPATFELQSGK